MSLYNTKDKREAKRITNVYVKNFPITWDEKRLWLLFSDYGPIKSLVLNVQDIPG